MKQLITIVIAISLFSTVYSQSPGGVSGSGANQLWLDANQLNLSNGSLLTTWTDKSGKGNNATVVTSVRKPKFKTAQINGLPSVVFDGTDDYVQTGAIAAMNVGTISQFMVFDGSGPAQVGVVLGGNYITHPQFLLNLKGTNKYRSWVIKSPNKIVDNLGVLNPSYQIIGSLWDIGTGLLSTYKDGAVFGVKGGATTIPTGNNFFRIGANSSGSGSYYFNAGIAEVILYSKTLNSAERNIVTNYLGAKYNIAVANDYYAYEATHGHDLIGVGKEADGSNTTARGASILKMSNPTTLANGEYIFAGHDGVAYTPGNSIDVPTPGNVRYGRVWRMDVQGGTELVDITIDVSTYLLGDPNSSVLLIDNDGVFAAGAVPIAGVYNAINQEIKFSGVSVSAGQYITLMVTSAGINSTGVTSDWQTATTWDCGCIPSTGSQVTILAGHTVDINGTDASVGDLTIDATGALTFSSSNKLTLGGDLTNNGTIAAGSGTFQFSGSVAQTIDGTQTFNHLTINNVLGVTVSSGATAVQGALTVSTGSSLTTGGLVTLLSNITGTGVLTNPSAGTIVGDLTIQRYVYENSKYYLIASPLINADLEDWNQEFEMEGFPGTERPNYYSSVKYYDETALVTSWYDGKITPTSTSDIATNGLGWEAYIDDDGIATGARTIDLTGTPKLGDGIVLTGTNSNTLADPDLNGWSLLGNPYASPIRWGSVAKTNVIAGYRKGTLGGFYAMNNGTSIASGEGFWVQFDVGGGSVTFDANDVQANIKDTYNESVALSFTEGDLIYFNLKLRYDSENEDLVEIGFSPEATDGLDIGMDAIKLNTFNTTDPNLSIEVGNRHYVRNIFPKNSDNLEIPLNIFTENPSSVNDNYELVFEGMRDILRANKRFQLEDREKGIFYDVLDDASFSVTMNDTTRETRFFLHVTEPLNVIAVNDVSCSGKNDGEIRIQAKGTTPVNYIWKNGYGDIIKQTQNYIGEDFITSLQAGDYTVEVQNNGVYGDNVCNFVINEPNSISASFSANENKNLTNWVYSNFSDTLVVETNKIITFYNESKGNNSYEWNFGDLTSSSMESPEHIYFDEGLYSATLTARNGICSEVSNQYIKVTAPLGINETNLLNNFNVIVKENEILISLNNDKVLKAVSFTIHNSIGQLVYTKNISIVGVNHQEKIDLDNAQGIYLITLNDGNTTKTKKIVLSKK